MVKAIITKMKSGVRQLFMSCIKRILFLLPLLLLALSEQVMGAPPGLGLPIRCIPGENCFIQNYFDHDPGPDYHDYTCGRLSYNGHHGTDFRLRDLDAMRAKVAVVAAAPGVVIGTRNNEPDITVRKRGKAALKGKDAGNGVRIDHGDGWSTQYSHMLQGSIRVHKGQRVESGDILGFVGLSGNTEFPHLDFSVSKDGVHIDPFNPERAACKAVPETLWTDPVERSLRYQATGLLVSGFSTTTPEREIAEDGGYKLPAIPADAENIVYWAELFGVLKNDYLSVELYGPNRQKLGNNKTIMSQNKAVVFSSTGKRRGASPWPKGTYSALLRLVRNGKLIVEEKRDITVMY